MNAGLLIVHDGGGLPYYLQACLSGPGREVHTAASVLDAEKVLSSQKIDLIIVDSELLYEADGLPCPQWTKRLNEELEAIVITPYASSSQAQTLGLERCCYLEKPFDLHLLESQVRHMVSRVQLKQEVQRLRGESKSGAWDAGSFAAVEDQDGSTEHRVSDEWFEIFDRLSKLPGSGHSAGGTH